MYEKVTPININKIADRIAGAMTDLIYSHQKNPTIDINVSINNNTFTVISESSYRFIAAEVFGIISRITGTNHFHLELRSYPPKKSSILNETTGTSKCTRTGLYRAEPVTAEQEKLNSIAKELYEKYNTPGIYIADRDTIKAFQASADISALVKYLRPSYHNVTVNPNGAWFSNTTSDSGRSNSEAFSDTGTFGKGMHGKDLGNPDLTVTIYAYLKAKYNKESVETFALNGAALVDNCLYTDMVKEVRDYIDGLGGFEKLAEWGLQ